MKGKILAIIPARGGSKGIPGKNIKELNGKPLMAYTIEEALKCPEIDRVVVSTDSKEIAQVAEKYGAEVPFMRPAQLAKLSMRYGMCWTGWKKTMNMLFYYSPPVL